MESLGCSWGRDVLDLVIPISYQEVKTTVVGGILVVAAMFA